MENDNEDEVDNFGSSEEIVKKLVLVDHISTIHVLIQTKIGREEGHDGSWSNAQTVEF